MVPRKVLQGLWGPSPVLGHTPDRAPTLSAGAPPSFGVCPRTRCFCHCLVSATDDRKANSVLGEMVFNDACLLALKIALVRSFLENLSFPLHADRLVLKLLGAALTEVGAREAVMGAGGRRMCGSICSSAMWVRTASCLLVWRLQGVEHTTPPFPGTFQQTQVNFRGNKKADHPSGWWLSQRRALEGTQPLPGLLTASGRNTEAPS